MRQCLVVLLLLVDAQAQRFSAGMKAGGILTESFDTSRSAVVSESKRYTIGPTVDIALLDRLRLSLDVLYKRTGMREFNGCEWTYCNFSQWRANVWEFPVLAKYRVVSRSTPLFASGGLVGRYLPSTPVEGSSWRSGPFTPGEQVDYTVRRSSAKLSSKSSVGFAAGAVIELSSGWLRFAPEFRYTHWTGGYWESFGPRGYQRNSNPHQAEILVGLRR